MSILQPNRKSIAFHIWSVVILAAVLSSGLICVVSLVQARSAIRSSTRQRMIDIANCAAGSINGDVLKKLTKNDVDTDEYRTIYNSLAVFRDNIETEYIYGIRKEEDGRFTFTVDPAIEDPGEFGEEVVKTDALVMASKGITAVDEEPYTDKWGTFYSAYSPVHDSNGNVAGIIGVDFSKEWYEGQQREQTRKTVIIYVIILIFTLLIVGAVCYAHIRSIMDPIKKITRIAGRYRDGDFEETLEIDRQDELGVLSSALQSMATSLTEQIMVAENANHAKSVFLANMSHEIRTPINAMLGNNEMILRESTDPAIRSYSDNVKVAGGQLLRLVDEILAYSKTGEKPEEKPAEGADDKKERFTAPSARILAVDDNTTNLQVFINLVKRTGVSVDTAESGPEGIELARKNKYDVLVLDHMMPEMDGIETLAKIRLEQDGLNVSTPVVCLTANAIPGAREFYMQSGFDDYLTKPVDPNELEKMLKTYIPDEKIEMVPADEVNTDAADEVIPEELRTLPDYAINTEAGIRNNGTVSSYMSILKMFHDTIEEKADELNRLYDEKDRENYTIKVHSLKSSLRIIGAEGLGEDAQRLEDAGKTDNGQYIRDHHGKFTEECVKLKRVLSGLFPKEDDSGRPEASDEHMKKVFDDIKAAAEEMDCDRLEAIFSGMEKYRVPSAQKELFAALKASSDRFEYSTITELLEKE